MQKPDSVLVLVLVVGLAPLGCSDDASLSTDADRDAVADVAVPDLDGPDLDDVTGAGATIHHDYTRAAGFYAAPFPDDSRLIDGVADIADFPNPNRIVFVRRIVGMIDGQADGFSLTAGLFFSLSGPIEIADLTLHASVAAEAPMFLIDVDADSPDYGRRYPFTLRFAADAGPFGAENLLSLVPLQGVPMRARTRYAAVVRRDLPLGEPLEVAPELAQLLAGERPTGLSEAAFAGHTEAIAALEDLGVDSAEIAGLAVFTTWDPVEALVAVREQVLEDPLPTPSAAPALAETFEDFCVFATTIPMPTFQAGEPPFTVSGGGWSFEEGAAVSQGFEEADLVMTVPRRAMPAEGFPLVVFLRVGGGGDRPLVDRGLRAEPGGDAIEPGTGPARDLARAGFAGLSVDGPHGGLRNVSGADEQFLIFNFTNPLALRDNIRQSALEAALTAHIAAEIAFDGSDCDGFSSAGDDEVIFDAERLALMGHSMGATVAIPTAAVEPAYGAVVVSGAGGSYIENVVYKQSPIAVRPLAETLLQYTGTGRELHTHDPVLSLLQWAGEPSDPPVFARFVVSEPAGGSAPRDVLMFQGIVDTYILPSIANAVSLSLALDLAGGSRDVESPRLDAFDPLAGLLDLVGRGSITLPASGNREIDGQTVTAVVVQHDEDGVEDGHEVMFQIEAAKHQYRCFLESFAAGGARVPERGGEDDACD